MTDILETIGREIRRQREVLGLSRQRLAEASGMSLRFLNDVERGRANPSVLKLQALAAALETPIETFFHPRPHYLRRGNRHPHCGCNHT